MAKILVFEVIWDLETRFLLGAEYVAVTEVALAAVRAKEK